MKRSWKMFFPLMILFLFGTCKYTFSQIILSGFDYNINVFWDFYSNNRMSTISAGKGYTGIAGDNDISGIVLNPASLSIGKKFQAHVEYVYKTDVGWSPNYDATGLTQLHPAFMIGGAYKFSDYLQCGLIYSTLNSQRQHLLAGNEFGQIIGEVHSDMSISSISLPLVLNYKDKIKAGINLMYLIYHGYTDHASMVTNPDGQLEENVNFRKFNAQFGLQVIPIKELSLGFVFTPQMQEYVSAELSDGRSISFNEPNIFPMKIGFGAEYAFSHVPLKLGFDYNYTNTSKQRYLYDRNDFHVGAEYILKKNIILRAGFFTLRDYRVIYPYAIFPGSYNQYFLTVGSTLKFNNFSASLALLDSHVLAAGDVQQTIINGGLTMDF